LAPFLDTISAATCLLLHERFACQRLLQTVFEPVSFCLQTRLTEL